jgi:3-carboxy-cis,cis-muconate cycloisomerase
MLSSPIAMRCSGEPASRAIHLGATSQDLVDTALVLQMREAIIALTSATKRLDAAFAGQVEKHRETMMTGRTWLQPAPPTTLGLKLAGTLAALRRGHERIASAAQRALVLQFGGAVGTLASLGDNAAGVSAELARVLDLREPELPWHTQRDNLVEMVQALAILTGTLAKFARDIALLAQAEVGEVFESADKEHGGSSTMPHKQNPVACAAVLAANGKMPGLVDTLLHAMLQEHERGLGSWQAEWDVAPEAFRLTAAVLHYSIDIAEGLVVDAERMRSNLDALQGLTLSEAVSAALTAKVGRSVAHDLLRQAAIRAKLEGRHLGEVLKQMPQVSEHLNSEVIDRLLNPHAYLGSARRFIQRVLEEKPKYG